MKVEGPKKYSPFCAPRNLKDKFIEDIRSFMDENNLIHNTNWKTEMMVIMKRINSTPADNEALDLLKDAVKKLDQQRNVKINNYIPDFNKYIND